MVAWHFETVKKKIIKIVKLFERYNGSSQGRAAMPCIKRAFTEIKENLPLL
jgi:hypothetical protein